MGQRLWWRSLVLFALTVLTVSCTDSEVAKQTYLENGNKLLAEKNYSAAVVEYRNAIRHDERFGSARHKLGQAYAALGDLDRAKRELVRAADLLPQDVDVQLTAAAVLLKTGEFDDARSRAESALKIDPKNADAHMARGAATAGLKDLDGAMRAFEEARDAAPDRPDMHVNVGVMHVARGATAEAEASFKQALALDPRSIPARLALANFYWSTGRLAEAETQMSEALGAAPNDVAANRAMANLLLATGRAAEAEAPLKRAAESTEDPAPTVRLADYYVFQKRHQDAAVILDALAARPGMMAIANLRRARIEHQLGRSESAFALLEGVLAKEPKNVAALVLKGHWLLAGHHLDPALSAAQAALAADPQAWEAHDLLGSVHVARKSREEAVQAFTEALRLNPRALRAQIALAELHMAEGRQESALRFAEEAVQSSPTSGLARLALVRALTATGEVARAERELQPLVVVGADLVHVQLAIGELEMRRRNFVGARRAFERASQIDPKSEAVVAALIRVDTGEKNTPEALKRADALVASSPGSADALYLAAKTQARAGNFALAESTLQKLVSLDPNFADGYTLLAEVYLNQQKLEDARLVYEGIIARRPTDLPAHTMLATLLQAQRKHVEARKMFEKILTFDSRSVIANNNLAYMYAEEGTDLNRALSLAQTAAAAAPNDPDVSDTLGWVYYKRDLPGPAIDAFKHSIAKDSKNPLYHFHLGLAYAKAEKPAEARMAIQQALKLDPNFEHANEARKILATQ
jgi:tetratricopeptide (TPR) repeat protein